ncbi:MAG: hypothetical protein EU544_04335 [Promethearchaeota archaeon]|nr:MAG: hypothetical protein EU544_04335 [Candidatus Lokiarchaeota archaeon]
MEDSFIKIIISGLDNAGKTSILTALDRKYDFRKAVMELKPTIRVEYHQTEFLSQPVILWDMGGQKKYRKLYDKRKAVYFDETDLLVYVIDVQDSDRYEESLSYLSLILSFFIENDLDIPIIIALHKYDPEIRSDENVNQNIDALRQQIVDILPDFKILFQLTSIYDLVSIVQLVSYGLSVFDEKFFELSALFEDYIEIFNAISLILFDQNGIIVSEFYNEDLDMERYVRLIESIKEHLFLLKRMEEEQYQEQTDFIDLEDNYVSYLHQITFNDQIFFLSTLLNEEHKDNFLKEFADFKKDINKILEEILS